MNKNIFRVDEIVQNLDLVALNCYWKLHVELFFFGWLQSRLTLCSCTAILHPQNQYTMTIPNDIYDNS